jgi:hypothetical protein
VQHRHWRRVADRCKGMLPAESHFCCHDAINRLV